MERRGIVIAQDKCAFNLFGTQKWSVDDWPRADWWTTLITDFATGKL